MSAVYVAALRDDPQHAGALFIIMQARRGTLTPTRYMQGARHGAIGALAGALVSTRQILLHIKPGDPGYGEPVMGLHLYSWALITFFCVLVYVGLASMLAPRGIPMTSNQGAAKWISNIVVAIILFMLVANVIAIIFLEGIAWVLPDDPTSYGLIDQIQGNPDPAGVTRVRLECGSWRAASVAATTRTAS